MLFEHDFKHSLYAQFANSPRLVNLIGTLDKACGLDNVNKFFRDVFDIRTAKGYGLDVWGRIVGLDRNVTVEKGDYFSFEETGSFLSFAEQSPNSAPLYSGFVDSKTVQMSDAFYRQMIIIKAQSNYARASVATMNTILMFTLLFFYGEGTAHYAYITQSSHYTEDMDLTGFFGQDFTLSEPQYQNFGHGVLSTDTNADLVQRNKFGFQEGNLKEIKSDKVQPLDHGILADDGMRPHPQSFALTILSDIEIPEPIQKVLLKILPIPSGIATNFEALYYGY